MSIISPARPPARSAGSPHGPSSLGYWIGAGLIAAACIGAAVWALLTYVGDLLWDAAPHVAGFIAVFLVGAAAGVTVIIVTAVRRSSARRLAAGP